MIVSEITQKQNYIYIKTPYEFFYYFIFINIKILK